MREMSVTEIAQAVGGKIVLDSGGMLVDNVQFDSRLCTATSLFIPLTGGQTNGHDYIQNAIEKGASVSFWSSSNHPLPEDCTIIQVADTLVALQDLARYIIDTSDVKVVGITGSNGKTTTKDMVEAVLATQFNTYKTQGNYNNEIGVPKTILDAPSDTEILVVEMGMDGFGQIDVLTKIARPHIAVITLIGDSHLEFLKSREGIAQAKLEIVNGLRNNGPLVVPSNEPLLIDYPGVKLLFGEQDGDDCQIGSIATGAEGTQFSIVNWDSAHVQLPIIGKYNAFNAAAALLVGRFFGVALKQQLEALSRFHLTENRTQWVDGYNGSRILNDAYNASPTSMKAILKDFQAISTTRKKYALLGDMRELGADSLQLHASISDVIKQDAFDTVYLYGEKMQGLYNVLKNRNMRVVYEKENKEKLVAELKRVLQPRDILLVKSSFGTDLLSVVKQLSTAL